MRKEEDRRRYIPLLFTLKQKKTSSKRMIFFIKIRNIMSAIIKSVKENSIGEDLDLKSGDKLISINGIVPRDLIDYRYLMASEEVDILIERTDNTQEIFEIEKDFEDDLGIIFECAVFDKIKPCANNCIFCFVNQQPEGLRPTLYVKDDDYRLSYLQGTYITLTNLTKKDERRLEELRLGPLYVSVHTTNPELRVKMLNNKRAGEINQKLDFLNSLDIPIHTQIVLCPGYNDGKELERTLSDLTKLKIVQSVAIVPVGITKFRKEKLKQVDKEIALKTIETVDKFNLKIKKHLISVSDEFYILAQKPFPEKKYYNNYQQLDDGVGSLRILIDDFEKIKLPKKVKNKKEVSLFTGEISYEVINGLLQKLNEIENVSIEVIPVKSKFWGGNVTVTGLITGQDLIAALPERKLKNSIVAIPGVMLRNLTETFLDGVELKEIEEQLGQKIFVIRNNYSLKEIVDLIKG